MAKRKKADRGYLVAHPSGFPGVSIPLLSDEECAARGIKPGRFPPRETWTQEQRDAADRLSEILAHHAFREAMYLILAELESGAIDPTLSEEQMEREAAKRALAVLDANKWKQRDTWIHLPKTWICQIIEMIARGDVSVLSQSRGSNRRGEKARKPPKRAYVDRG